MERILLDLDDNTLKELERVAPVKKRMRAEFIRLAIRRALDLALDRETEGAYRHQPLTDGFELGDLTGWDETNQLTKRKIRTRRRDEASASRKRAA